MLTLHRRTVPAAVLTLVLGLGIAGCSSDDGGTTPGTNPVVGTWNATSLSIQGGPDLIAQGMGYSIVFNSDDTFVSTTTNDMAGFCDMVSNCLDSGDYTASDTQIILDAGTSDAFTVNYSISGTTMTLTFTLNGMASVLVLDKV